MKKNFKKIFSGIIAIGTILNGVASMSVSASSQGTYSVYGENRFVGINQFRTVGTADGTYIKVVSGNLKLISGGTVPATGSDTNKATTWVALSSTNKTGTYKFSLSGGTVITVDYQL